MKESEHLSRYRKERTLFAGVFTEVSLVTDLCTGEPRVLKASDIDLYPCENVQQLFNELVFHGLVVSPFVIRKHFSFQVGRRLYVVLEFAENGDLFNYGWIEARPLTDEFIRKVFFQTCLALQAVHAKGLVHRDVKPENILLDKNFDVKLCDFGWCCEAADPLSNAEQAGTLAYMSPEALRCQPQSAASDVWALAVLLYEMYHKTEPFPGSNCEERLHSILTTKPVFSPLFPPDAADIFRQCTAVDPLRRRPLAWILEHPFLRQLADRKTPEPTVQPQAEQQQIEAPHALPKSNKNPYSAAVDLIPSFSSIELSVKNYGSNYVPLLCPRKPAEQLSTRREPFQPDLALSRSRIDEVGSEQQGVQRYSSLARDRAKASSCYRPLSLPKRESESKPSGRRPKLQASRDFESRGERRQDKPTRQNAGWRQDVAIGKPEDHQRDPAMRRVTAIDLLRPDLNLYEPAHAFQVEAPGRRWLAGSAAGWHADPLRAPVSIYECPSPLLEPPVPERQTIGHSHTGWCPPDPCRLAPFASLNDGHSAGPSNLWNGPLNLTLPGRVLSDSRPAERLARTTPFSPAPLGLTDSEIGSIRCRRVLKLKPRSQVSASMVSVTPRDLLALPTPAPLSRLDSKLTASTLTTSRLGQPASPRQPTPRLASSFSELLARPGCPLVFRQIHGRREGESEGARVAHERSLKERPGSRAH